MKFNPRCYSAIFEQLDSLREEKASLSVMCVYDFVELKDRVYT